MILSFREFDLLSANPFNHFYPMMNNNEISEPISMIHGSLMINENVTIKWSEKERINGSIADYEMFVTGFYRDSDKILFRAKCCCANISRIYLDMGEAAVIDYFSLGTDWSDLCENVFSIDPLHDDHDLMDTEELHDKMIDQMNLRFKTNFSCMHEFPDVVFIDFVQKMSDHPHSDHVKMEVIKNAIMAALYDAGNGPNLLMALRPSPLQYCVPEEYWSVFGLDRFNCSDRSHHTDKLTKLYAAHGFNPLKTCSCTHNAGWSLPDSEPPMMFSMIIHQ